MESHILYKPKMSAYENKSKKCMPVRLAWKMLVTGIHQVKASMHNFYFFTSLITSYRGQTLDYFSPEDPELSSLRHSALWCQCCILRELPQQANERNSEL